MAFRPLRTSADDDGTLNDSSITSSVTQQGSGSSPLKPSNAAASESQSLLDSHAEEDAGQATLFSSVANLSNTILGTGMLALPHAIAQGGLVTGFMLISLAGAASALGLYLLSRCCARLGSRQASFTALASLTYPAASTFFDAAIALKCFGVSISYLIIMGSLTPQVVDSLTPKGIEPHPVLLDRRLWISLSMIILTPLGFLRRLHSLRFTSYLALLAVASLCLLVVVNIADPSHLPQRGEIHLFRWSAGLLTSLPIYVFAFTCAQNLCSVYNELQSNTQSRMNIASFSSIGAAAIIYQLVGCLGYISFGAAVSSNIMLDYHNSVLASIVRIGVTLFVLFSYPLQLHPCRASLDKVLAGQQAVAKAAVEGTQQEEPTPHEIPQGKFIAMTVGILVATYTIAMNVQNLSVVLGIVGATGSTTVSFILPGLFFLALFRNDLSAKDRILRIFAWILLVTGLTLMIVCLSLQVWQAQRSTRSPHPSILQQN
ncbi:uncharacterized protein L969DRAFT_97211 [Mixia osmundae IAM 14324]|uniref:Amino acid transporter transmembrane domain-containing protein n=1 Tax=Mixia osmundae (strain CBS 9802 / IAM 14324 / JCM 22182 / KY 12970) TaxID=764103 RepID=G7DW20_MIXOS|nr:uncharacterized protein L969DRAFT_97211 [Mixia osmundae IAM 14324]KEI36474.1 hypothetical protein L969DRAFT_97211 [Mixia osmundae IAM 14324]GAA94826.1 hypothetical protein E5Q_01480 [Mixia osmundae IAM 14324]